MSFPYMKTSLTRRLVLNKQVDKRHFSQGLMAFPYVKTSFMKGLMSAPFLNTNLTKRLVFNKQAGKREKRETGSEKGEFFSQGLMSAPDMNTTLTKRLVTACLRERHAVLCGGAEEITEDKYESMTAAVLEQGAGADPAPSQNRAA